MQRFAYFVVFALAGSTAIVANLVGVTYAVQLVAVTLAINFALRLSPGIAYRLAALSFGSGVILFIAMYAAGYTATSADLGCRWCLPDLVGGRSTTSLGRPITTWPMSTRSSPASGGKGPLPG